MPEWFLVLFSWKVWYFVGLRGKLSICLRAMLISLIPKNPLVSVEHCIVCHAAKYVATPFHLVVPFKHPIHLLFHHVGKKCYLFNGKSLMLLVTVFMDQLSIVSTFFFIIWWQKCGLYNGNLLISLLTVSLHFMDHNFRLLPLWKKIFIQDDHFLINFYC